MGKRGADGGTWSWPVHVGKRCANCDNASNTNPIYPFNLYWLCNRSKRWHSPKHVSWYHRFQHNASAPSPIWQDIWLCHKIEDPTRHFNSPIYIYKCAYISHLVAYFTRFTREQQDPELLRSPRFSWNSRVPDPSHRQSNATRSHPDWALASNARTWRRRQGLPGSYVALSATKVEFDKRNWIL
jgi:hypothetical protein